MDPSKNDGSAHQSDSNHNVLELAVSSSGPSRSLSGSVPSSSSWDGSNDTSSSSSQSSLGGDHEDFATNYPSGGTIELNSNGASTSDEDPVSATPPAASQPQWDPPLSPPTPPPLPSPPPPPSSTSLPDASSATTPVPADKERQLLLLMLLGQVCALHDPTPRTFTAHVLEFFERGILDRQSIHFLYKLGLVPPSPASPSPSSSSWPLDDLVASSAPPAGAVAATAAPLLLTAPPPSPQEPSEALVAATRAGATTTHHRAAEASAIRSSLERHERQRVAAAAAANNSHRRRPQTPMSPSLDPPTPPPMSFAAEHHPLSFSRFQREFENVQLLSAGAFGTVFRASSKLDNRQYAIKRVEFTAKGYASESVDKVVREVRCLAACDHANVVRYYTGWLEPSWMAGSSSTGTGRPHGAGTLAHATIESLDESHSEWSGAHQDMRGDSYQLPAKHPGALHHYDDMQAFLKTTSSLPQRRAPRHHRRPSWDESTYGRNQSCDSEDDDDESSGWCVDHCTSVSDDEDNASGLRSRRLRRNQWQGGGAVASLSAAPSHYRYQISLFIQMQLCQAVTLADWIRERNQSGIASAARLELASQIFAQVSNGLAHVHQKGIIHRDLKPANIFVSHEADGLNFKIGDFGLSTLFRSSLRDGTSSPRHITGNANANHHSHSITFEEIDKEGNNFVVPPDEPPDLLYERNCDPLTAGVGTASYASPEQVNSRTYGSSADIFSLGLILLEILCCFSTEHERLQVFRKCRQHRSLPEEMHDFPTSSHTVLSCTEPEPSMRPSALHLSQIHLTRDLRPPRKGDDQVQALLRQLHLKDREIEQYKLQLEEKQRIIDALLQDAERLRVGSPSKVFHFPRSPCFDAEQVITNADLASSSSSSSSEDEL